MTTRAEVTCTRCGAPHTITVHDSINVAERPELKAQVLDGSLFVWECPHCGAHNLLRANLLYHDPAERLMVWMTGGSAELEERVSAAYGGVAELKDYTLRFVDEPGALIEKVKIFDTGLDDIVMEMAKYVTRMEIAGSCEDRAEEILRAPFRFLRLDGADHELTFAYPLDGQMQMATVGFNVYEDCRGILGRHPALAEAAAGFAKVDDDWIRKFFN